MMPFDMPPASVGFPARGRWVINHLMTDLGIGIIPAAGIVGNLGFESTGFTQLHEVGQPEGFGGYGWGQWTAARRTTFFNWCAGHLHLPWESDEANYGYLIHELTTNGSTADAQAWVLAHVKTCVDLEGSSGSVFVFGRYYEAPGGTTDTHLPGYDGRLSYAKQALAAPGPLPGPAPPTVLAIPSARDLQSALAAAGLYQGTIDGIWGTHSQQALAAFYAGHQS